jgi:hypothetical protein
VSRPSPKGLAPTPGAKSFCLAAEGECAHILGPVNEPYLSGKDGWGGAGPRGGGGGRGDPRDLTLRKVSFIIGRMIEIRLSERVKGILRGGRKRRESWKEAERYLQRYRDPTMRVSLARVEFLESGESEEVAA